MNYQLYIIQSLVDGTYYKGITCDIVKRLAAHNNGESRYTSNKMPWKLVYIKAMPDKTSALIEEKRIKKLNRASLEKLISV
jgi:putative endonuclease